MIVLNCGLIEGSLIRCLTLESEASWRFGQGPEVFPRPYDPQRPEEEGQGRQGRRYRRHPARHRALLYRADFRPARPSGGTTGSPGA